MNHNFPKSPVQMTKAMKIALPPSTKRLTDEQTQERPCLPSLNKHKQ